MLSGPSQHNVNLGTLSGAYNAAKQTSEGKNGKLQIKNANGTNTECKIQRQMTFTGAIGYLSGKVVKTVEQVIKHIIKESTAEPNRVDPFNEALAPFGGLGLNSRQAEVSKDFDKKLETKKEAKQAINKQPFVPPAGLGLEKFINDPKAFEEFLSNDFSQCLNELEQPDTKLEGNLFRASVGEGNKHIINASLKIKQTCTVFMIQSEAGTLTSEAKAKMENLAEQLQRVIKKVADSSDNLITLPSIFLAAPTIPCVLHACGKFDAEAETALNTAIKGSMSGRENSQIVQDMIKNTNHWDW